MEFRRTSFALAAAALVSVAASGAWAADKASKPVDFTVRSEPTRLDPNAGRTFKYDASKGRFGITVRLQQPETRPVSPNDVQAGAYFRITPSIQVGGSVALGEQDLAPRGSRPVREADQPKVRLESTLKF
ncbi:MAG: hypothetical protein JNK30_01995 [Phenylobacterium sp.]|uniref:NtrZ family periplasmic regulatory protein n=1 Tax=Phenylobacterium sp. TaxID=1871053 RepID=UPI001A5F078D|nr:hypothetical protein [Phenylobacterium sp.]MBL8770127.1 hypothetical protein [Phenylobacterium sp.]